MRSSRSCRYGRLSSPDATILHRRTARPAMAGRGAEHPSRTDARAPRTYARGGRGDAPRTMSFGTHRRHDLPDHGGVPGRVVAGRPRGPVAGATSGTRARCAPRARVPHRGGRSGRGPAQPSGKFRRTSHSRCSRQRPSCANVISRIPSHSLRTVSPSGSARTFQCATPRSPSNARIS